MGNLSFYLDENLSHKETIEYDCMGYDLDEVESSPEQGEYMGRSYGFKKNCIDKALASLKDKK